LPAVFRITIPSRIIGLVGGVASRYADADRMITITPPDGTPVKVSLAG
jgi:hypothetical protein